MSEFKVESVMKTGKGNPQFGSEYYVKFYESEQSFPLWFKTDPQVDQIIMGDIEGSKFKKEKREWTNSPGTQTATTPSAPAARPAFKDTGDDIFGGQCLNKAADHVTAVSVANGIILTDKEYADEVYKYTLELYKKGRVNAA